MEKFDSFMDVIESGLAVRVFTSNLSRVFHILD